MLRFSVSRGLLLSSSTSRHLGRQTTLVPTSPVSATRRAVVVTGRSNSSVISPPPLTTRADNLRLPGITRPYHHNNTPTTTAVIPLLHARCFSSNTSNDKRNGDKDDDDAKELVLTPGQKVVAASRLSLWLGIGVLASFCAYYIIKELLPSKMSPNSVFDKSFSVIKNHPEVLRRFGGPIKAYGKDWGGHREGRRNFVEHSEYADPEDGSKRTRVRYNLEGQFGAAFVFAEVSNNMPSGEFVYVLVQDKSNGRVITVVDNRSRMAAERMMGDNKEGANAFASLLGGNKGGGN
eukprot:CAMPEP_0172478520 /NCGR_PEP_ID=MMETSP1066-20121228/2544_1 /TAXON_ID=671091 /ORGANISM="Coscinodiscus wailesii, Strain CCMP2513" /LENGTH=291 /DNA_ID=CAMNT_0013238171 /DNA_START=163 /DNA_END=1038 /DNA_ORIENTATION=+